MRIPRLWVLWAASLAFGQTPCRADELPKIITSASCSNPPTIDGILGEEEWKSSPPLDFTLNMAQAKAPAAIEKRVCQLRVMNSANGLYLGLRVPDETVNNRLAPFDLDLAIVAFCRGQDVAAGDDRKGIGGGLYLDKHVTTPGQDADDKHQDGRGGMTYDKGVYTFEWAIPLDSGDPEDIQVKPGDKLRFNLAYFDAFRAGLDGTRVGVAYAGGLDHAADWGTIQLAADVKNDGGAAFRGPLWVESLLKSLPDLPARRLRLVDSSYVPGQLTPLAKATVAYDYRDPQGQQKTGQAKLYLPAVLQHGTAKVPLYFNAGYELDDRSALNHLRRGFAVVTPSELEANPLVRTANPDIALLHIARALPFVDDTRVVIGGGSAGGYITLLLAAETFPLAGAAPDVPPVNWGYNAAYFFKQRELVTARAKGATTPRVPVLAAVGQMLERCPKLYGADYDDATWFAHSPLAHIPTITCPVVVYWSTADVLVPIDQIGRQWVRPFEAGQFPDGFAMDPEKLTNTREGRLRLTDVLSDESYELFVLPQDHVKRLAPGAGGAQDRPELPVSRSKQWSITILDEGRPEPQLGHVKYEFAWSHNAFIDEVATGKIPARQLTPLKLERLMDRFAGQEWLPSRLKHLDSAESERADVLRGLRSYVAAGPENAKTFGELYGKLPAAKQVLDAGLLKSIQETK